MKENASQELFIDELRDLYDAENRLVKAIPKMAKAANSDGDLLENHAGVKRALPTRPRFTIEESRPR